MRNILGTISLVGGLAISSLVQDTRQVHADAFSDILRIGVELQRVSGHPGVRKIEEKKLPDGCRTVYMEIAGNSSFVHSTLVCHCGKEVITKPGIEEK